ncbi:MAG: hypothetical protein ACTHU0_33165, partial [Kofleriaceae bacterium]
SAVLLLAVIAACRSSSKSEPSNKPLPAAAPTATAQVQAQPPSDASEPGSPAARLSTLRGPHPTLEAACPEDSGCQTIDLSAAPTGEPLPFREVRLLAIAGDEPDDGRCAIALHVAAGWFVATSADARLCVQPSYVEVATFEVAGELARDGQPVAVLDVTVNHHTKSGDEEGDHRWAALCGVAASGPWCTQQISRACDDFACLSSAGSWTREIELPGNGTLVVTTNHASSEAREAVGTFALPR